MDVNKVTDEILKSIEIIIQKHLDSLTYDRTYIVPVTKIFICSADTYKYTVRIGQNDHTVNSKLKFTVGERVRVKIPCNDWSNIYLEKHE